MNALSDLFGPMDSMTLPIAAMRLSLARALGALIGWERERREREAGLRTHMLICLAAAIFTLIAMELTFFPDGTEGELRVDPLRLIEAVTAGVAFLAAGSIITSGGNVRGLTTGASMWLAGAIGLACGAGNGQIAVLGTGMGLAVLWIVRLTLKPLAHGDDGK